MAQPKTAEEIVHIEHELEILRDRLVRFIYWGGVLKVVVPAGGYIVAAVLVAASLAASNSNPAMSGVGLIAALIVAIVVWLSCRNRTLRYWSTWHRSRVRWDGIADTLVRPKKSRP
jgi:hypothetical protein